MELSIIKFLSQIGAGYVDSLTGLISNEIFLSLLWMITALSFLFSDKANGKRIFIAVIIALSLHFSISEGLIKNLLADYFFRPRPYLADSGIIALGKPYADSSFPSSHMASTLSVLAVYFYYYRKYWPVMLAFVLLMAFSRMHNGMHYPSDVLAGTIFGIMYGMGSIYSVNKIYNRRKLRK